MARQRIEKEVTYLVEVRDGGGNITGRGSIRRNIDTAGSRADRYMVEMTQTYGGAAEGRLKTPVLADIEVLREFVAAADEIKAESVPPPPDPRP